MTGASLIRRHLVGAQSSRCAQSPRTYSVISTGTREACVVERSILASPGISPLRGYATTVEMNDGGGRNDCGRGSVNRTEAGGRMTDGLEWPILSEWIETTMS